MISCHDCGVSENNDKTIRTRQCDWLLCDACEASRATGVIRKKGSYASGAIARSPPTLMNSARKILPELPATEHNVPKQITTSTSYVKTPKHATQKLCPGRSCSIKAGDPTVSCFICQGHFHLPCVKLKRRPSKNSNWCCSQCSDVPSIIRELNNNIKVLSAWQETMHAQQQDLKAENKALNEQIKELMQQVSKYQHPTQADKVDEACPPTSNDLSDIPMTDSENADVDTTWSTVTGRRRKSLPVKRTLDRAFRYDSRESNDPDFQERKKRKKKRRQENGKKQSFRHDYRESSDNKPMRKRKQQSFRRGAYYANQVTRHQVSNKDFDHVTDHHRVTHRHDRESHDYERHERRRWNRRACFNCGLTNHTSNECHFKNPVTCRTCGEIGHKSRWHRDHNDLRHRN